MTVVSRTLIATVVIATPTDLLREGDGGDVLETGQAAVRGEGGGVSPGLITRLCVIAISRFITTVTRPMTAAIAGNRTSGTSSGGVGRDGVMTVTNCQIAVGCGTVSRQSGCGGKPSTSGGKRLAIVDRRPIQASQVATESGRRVTVKTVTCGPNSVAINRLPCSPVQRDGVHYSRGRVATLSLRVVIMQEASGGSHGLPVVKDSPRVRR